jgi:hypothetical protein
MAVKAICSIGQVLRDPDDHSLFVVVVSFAVLTDTSISSTHVISGLDPSGSAATTTLQIESAMKTFLEGEGVTFGLLDSVRLVPAL